MLNWLERPVILLGHGIRAAGVDAAPLLNLGVPVLSSWQAADVVDNHHQGYFGRPGIYGQRCANNILHEADQVIALGNRLAIWNVGYEGIRKDQELIQCDIDDLEFERHPHAVRMQRDLKLFCRELSLESADVPEWLEQCNQWRDSFPWLESPTHDHGEYLNSYRVIHDIGRYLKPDSVIVTEMGAALCGAFQVLKFKPPQRIITSGGLGEMGCGLPMAIGAAFASGGEVILLATDGGLMLNLQELQTLVHHQLPVKIFVFENDGYGMLKHTQKNLGYEYHGVDKASGVSCPDFFKLGYAFGMPAAHMRKPEDVDKVIVQMMQESGPCLAVVHIDPEQKYHPKLEPIVEDGKARSPQFNELSPIL